MINPADYLRVSLQALWNEYERVTANPGSVFRDYIYAWDCYLDPEYYESDKPLQYYMKRDKGTAGFRKGLCEDGMA